MNTYESANIRRWFLIILNIVFFLGVFWPLIPTNGQAITAWTIRQRLGIRYLKDSWEAVFGFGVVATLFFLFVLLCPVLHLFKLLGFFGEARRNSRGWSLLFSIFELIGVIGLPITCILRYSVSTSYVVSMADMAFLFSNLSAWPYLWLALSIVAIVMSDRLEYTPPVFRSLSRNSTGYLICEECGKRNPGDANFCLGCGAPFAHEEEEIAPWYCPKCGEKNSSDAKKCGLCGARKPKDY